MTMLLAPSKAVLSGEQDKAHPPAEDSKDGDKAATPPQEDGSARQRAARRPAAA